MNHWVFLSSIKSWVNLNSLNRFIFLGEPVTNRRIFLNIKVYHLIGVIVELHIWLHLFGSCIGLRGFKEGMARCDKGLIHLLHIRIADRGLNISFCVIILTHDVWVPIVYTWHQLFLCIIFSLHASSGTWEALLILICWLILRDLKRNSTLSLGLFSGSFHWSCISLFLWFHLWGHIILHFRFRLLEIGFGLIKFGTCQISGYCTTSLWVFTFLLNLLLLHFTITLQIFYLHFLI